MIKLFKDFIKHLFQFSVLKDILTFYVLTLSIFTILIATKNFDISVKPNVQILEPIYSFNAQKIIKKFHDSSNYNTINKYENLKRYLINDISWNSSILAYYYQEYDLVNNNNEYAAYETYAYNNDYNDVSGYIVGTEWYLWGIKDTFPHYVKPLDKLLAKRSEADKMHHLRLLLSKALSAEADSMFKNDSNLYINRKLSKYQYILFNPLFEISKYDYQNSPDFFGVKYSVGDNSSIYSCLSICNFSEQPIQNITLN